MHGEWEREVHCVAGIWIQAVVVPLGLGVIGAGIDENSQLAIEGRGEFESSPVLQGPRVLLKMMLGASVVMRLRVKISVFDLNPNDEGDVAGGIEIAADGHRAGRPAPTQ